MTLSILMCVLWIADERGVFIKVHLGFRGAEVQAVGGGDVGIQRMAVFGLCQVLLTHKDCGLLRHESDFIFHQHQWLTGVLDADSVVVLVTRYDLHGVSAGFGICRLTGYETHKWLIVFAKFIDGRFWKRPPRLV